MAEILKENILQELEALEKVDPNILVKKRIEKFCNMGFWEE